MKRLICVLLMACALLSLAACDSKSEIISAADAQKIVLEEMGMTGITQKQMHTHVSMKDDIVYYNVYVSVGGVNVEYRIDGVTGEILHKGESDHSH